MAIFSEKNCNFADESAWQISGAKHIARPFGQPMGIYINNKGVTALWFWHSEILEKFQMFARNKAMRRPIGVVYPYVFGLLSFTSYS